VDWVGSELIWVVLGLAGWPLGRWLAPRLAERLGDRAWLLAELGPWPNGLALPYLAVFAGAVSAEAMGLYGRGGWLGWQLSAAMIAALLLAIWRTRNRLPFDMPDERLDHALLDEPRWAMYRAAGQLWLTSSPLGLGLGLVLGLLEWAVRHELWRPEQRARPATCLTLARLATSTIVFGLTGNLLMTAAFQAALLSLLRPAESQVSA